ncbi:MAG: alpha-galactosidase [Oscillospiraceae bacterium]|nr:alpha-galactosidase [Oscillospiraceae bacterium]
MIRFNVEIETAEDVRVFQGEESFDGGLPENGPYNIICDIPAGKLRSVKAVLDLTVPDNVKIFMNGYQTWTNCPEYGKYDRIRGLHGIPKPVIDKFHFDRYGDYHFVDYPNKRGVTHGFSWCYFRRGNRYRLIASLDEKPGYTMFTYDSTAGKLTIERDCAGVRFDGGEFHAFDLYFAEGSEEQVFDGWFRVMGIPAPKAPTLKGYSSWYNRYEDISEQSIEADLEGCKKLFSEGDLFQIDDGWEPAVGDWLETDEKKFPNGLKPLADKIHESGFIAGLWLAPFVCREGSALMKEHPDWLLQIDGKPWSCGSNWGGFYSLDIDNEEVTDYLRKVFDRVLNEWGFDLVKLDFLYGAAPFGTEKESRAGRMIRAMDFLREVCGDKLILGCGVPVMPAFGRVDYCRVSCDVSLDWDDKWYMRMFHRERVSTKQAIENTVFRRQLNGRAYISDPDVFFLRESNIAMTKARKLTLAKVNALLGGVLLTSDDPSSYNDEQLEIYNKLLKLAKAEYVKVIADRHCIKYIVEGKKKVLRLPEEWFR